MNTPRQLAAHYGVRLECYREDMRSALQQSRENAGLQGRSRAEWFDWYFGDYVNTARMEDFAALAFEAAAY